MTQDADRIDLKAPKDWSEVTVKQLRHIARLSGECLTREETLLALLCRFTGIRHEGKSVFVTKDRRRFAMPDWMMADFCGRLAFIIDELPRDVANPTRISPHLGNTRFGDYFHADALLYGYRLQGGTRLARKALRDLGQRKPFVTKTFADMVSMWWSSVQLRLKEQYPDVFAGDETSAEPYDPITARSNIMLMLNESRPQDNTLIEQSLTHDVLGALQHRIEEAKRMEEIAKKHR